MDTKDYCKLIWNETKKEVFSYYRRNIQDWGGDLITALFTALASALFFYFKNGEKINFLSIFISVIVGVISTFIFRVIVTKRNAHARLYKQKEIEANKYTWNDVVIDIPDMPKDNPLPACLILINNKQFNIEQVIVEVENVKKGHFQMYIDTPIYIGWGDEINDIWSPKTLYMNQEEGKVLAIANWLHEGSGVFLLATNDQKIKANKADFIELEKGTQYTLQLLFRGKIGERDLDEYRKWYSLKYDDNKIYLKAVS